MGHSIRHVDRLAPKVLQVVEASSSVKFVLISVQCAFSLTSATNVQNPKLNSLFELAVNLA